MFRALCPDCGEVLDLHESIQVGDCVYCAECGIRSCCQERELDNCAYCPDYICDKLQQFFQYAPEAKKLLDQIHQGELPGA